MSDYHRLVNVETEIANERRTRARCSCIWNSGWRRTRHVAIEAHGIHVVKMERMTIARARAIAYDHAHGLHDEYDDPDIGCRWIGCEDAFWIIAHAQESESFSE